MLKRKLWAPSWTIEEDAELIRRLNAAPDRGQEEVYAAMVADPFFKGRTFYALRGRAQKLRESGLLIPRARLSGSKRAAENAGKAQARRSNTTYTERPSKPFMPPVLARPSFFDEPNIKRLLTAGRA